MFAPSSNWPFTFKEICCLPKKTGGKFLLRIEDSDAQRSELVFLDSLMQDLC